MDRVPGERRRIAVAAGIRALPWTAGGVAVCAAGWLAWRYAVEGDLLRIREVRFGGNARATAAELVELSPVQPGDHLLAIDTAALEAALRRHPWVERATATRRWPPAIEVEIAERRPVALVELGGLYAVDAKGEVFKRAQPGDGLDLPLITGIGRDEWTERQAEAAPLLADALDLLSRWTSRKLDARAPISEIHVDAGYGETVFTGDGMEIRLGRDGLDAKLERLDRVLSALDAEGQRAEVVHLDDRRRPDRVAVRLVGVGGGG